MSDERPKIAIRDIYKIFGPDPAMAHALVLNGATKEQLLEETGHVIGLRDISLDIHEGETFVVMGLSGSGKSTLIRHLNRLILPTAGQILVDDQDVLALSEAELLELRRHRMSMVFQRFALLPHKTVEENVAYGLEIGGVRKQEARAAARKCIEQVGLSGFENRFPKQLSGGMQQRVGLARALATNAEILLMDEAFSALDPLIRTDMQDQLLELQSRLRKTIVFITHDLDEALRLGDHIAILKDGELRQVGSPEEILLHPADDYVTRFVQDVNRGRVVTVGSVVRQAPTMQLHEARFSLAQRKMTENETNVVYVLDENGRLAGVVTEELIQNMLHSEDGDSFSREDLQDAPCSASRTVIDEILPIVASNDVPVAVLDDEGHFLGAVSRIAVINALARSPERLREEADGPSMH